MTSFSGSKRRRIETFVKPRTREAWYQNTQHVSPIAIFRFKRGVVKVESNTRVNDNGITANSDRQGRYLAVNGITERGRDTVCTLYALLPMYHVHGGVALDTVWNSLRKSLNHKAIDSGCVNH
jgi:hypothetical protein